MPEQQNNTQQNTAPQAPSNQHNYDENVIKIILSALAKLKEAFKARKRKKYDYYTTPFEEKVEQLEKQLNNLDEQDAVFCDCLRDVAETLEKISGSIVGGELKGITPDEFFDLFNEIEKNLSNTSNKFILSDKKVETVLKETFGNDVLDKVYKKDEKDQRLLTDNVKFYMAKSGDRADLYMMIGENAVKISKIQKDNDNEVLFLDKTKLYEKDGKVYLNNPENSMPLEQLHLAPNLTIEKAIGKAMFRCEKDYLDARKAKGENIRSQAAEITGTESSPFKKDTLRCFVDDKGYYIKDEKENDMLMFKYDSKEHSITAFYTTDQIKEPIEAMKLINRNETTQYSFKTNKRIDQLLGSDIVQKYFHAMGISQQDYRAMRSNVEEKTKGAYVDEAGLKKVIQLQEALNEHFKTTKGFEGYRTDLDHLPDNKTQLKIITPDNNMYYINFEKSGEIKTQLWASAPTENRTHSDTITPVISTFNGTSDKIIDIKIFRSAEFNKCYASVAAALETIDGPQHKHEQTNNVSKTSELNKAQQTNSNSVSKIPQTPTL